MAPFSISKRQTDVLKQVLNLNVNPDQQSIKDAAEEFKILVLDQFNKDIVAPLLRLNDLREFGVTLHLQLESDRQPVPGVSAVYIIQPTEAAVQRLSKDISEGLYESYYINFTTSAPSKFLEVLATDLVRSNSVHRVAKIHDQYINFISLEPSLFHLAQPKVYTRLNSHLTQDAEIQSTVNAVVDGLFSVFATLGEAPEIRFPRRGVAEKIAQDLYTRIRDNLRAPNSLFLSSSAASVIGGVGGNDGPLTLCLLDRNFDLAAALQHSWTYKPLVHDLLGMKLNRVTVHATGNGEHSTAAVARPLDVDDRDWFWQHCGAKPFPEVAEEADKQLQSYRAAVEEINRQTAGGGNGSGSGSGGATGALEGSFDPDAQMKRSAQGLRAAVSSLPALQEKKKIIDKHMSIATALLTAIKARGIDQLQSTEEEALAAPGSVNFDAAAKLILTGKGTVADKLRLAAVCLLVADGFSEAEAEKLQGALAPHLVKVEGGGVAGGGVSNRSNNIISNSSSSVGSGSSNAPSGGLGDLLAKLGPEAPQLLINYIRFLKKFNLVGGGGMGGGGGTGGGMGGGGGSSLLEGSNAAAAAAAAAQTNLRMWADKTFGQVTKSVKTMLGGKRRSRIVEVIERMMLLSKNIEDPDYGSLEPRAAAKGRSAYANVGVGGGGEIQGGRAVVFVVGGGNYLERQSLLTWTEELPAPPKIIYGSTDIISGEDFLCELIEVKRGP